MKRTFLPALLATCIAGAQDTPAPAPAAAPAQSEMQKWIATTDEQWQAVLKREVTDVHGAELNKLKLQYLTSLEAGITKASGAGDLNVAVALRNEQKRFGDTQVFPEQDDAADAASVKQLRAAIRIQIARLEKERAARTKALHAKYDQVLAQAQTQLTQRQRFDDALLVKAKRDEVAAAWISPSTADTSVRTPPSSTVLKTPPATKPAAGTAMPDKSEFGKSGTKPGVLDEAIVQRIKAVIDAHSFERLEPAAGRGLAHSDLPREGAILVGFEHINGTWKGDKMVKSLKPLFLTPDGVVSGISRGNPDNAYKTLKAREGFAVSGLIVNPGKERLGGFQMIFVKMQSRPTPFEKPETYKSEWIGGELRKDAVTLGGDGRLGIGVIVCAGADVDGIGLIVAPQAFIIVAMLPSSRGSARRGSALAAGGSSAIFAGMSITLEVDEATLLALPLGPGERERHMQIELACRYYAKGWLSLGQAAGMAGMDQFGFACELAERGIPRNYTVQDALHDVTDARSQ